jgi:hypothetical protein
MMVRLIIGILAILQMASASQAQNDFLTPLEKSRFSHLSSYEDMMFYLNALDKESKILSISIAGKSVMGRDIPLLHIYQDNSSFPVANRKIRVLVICQQHGTEPSGKEAALILTRYLLKEYSYFLETLDIYIIPVVNPDGAELGQRKNSNNVDLNMNYVRLDQPESEAVHNVFLDLKPEVTLDVHEYNAVRKEWVSKGLIRDAEVMLDGPTNLNISSDLIDFSQKIVIAETGEKIKKEGFRFHRLVIGTPFKDDQMRFSSAAIRDGRQSFGIYNTLSFVLEGKRYADGLSHIKRRTEAQLLAILAFLKTIATHHAETINRVDSARADIVKISDREDKLVHIQMDYFPDPKFPPVSFPFFDLYKWKKTEIKLNNFHPVTKSKKSIRCPRAYIFKSDRKDLISLLKKHRVKMDSVISDTILAVEIYKILQDVPSREEEKFSRKIDVLVRKEMKTITQQYKIIFLDQPAGQLIPLLLEPQSTWGILSVSSGMRKRFKKYARKNSDYPIWRVSDMTNTRDDQFKSENNKEPGR